MIALAACSGAPASPVPTAPPPTTATQPPAATSAPTQSGGPVIISGAGDIVQTVAQYQGALGGQDNGGKPGTQSSGFRLINWDAVPDELASPNNLPSDFFNDAADPRARGAFFSTPGTGVQVSAKTGNPAGTAPRFGNINPQYANIFKTFSPERLFSPIGSNIVDLTFFVPGSKTPATVRGFGAVYTNVRIQHTSFEYFDL
ncbi:MAG TPA: hypothetical protein VFG86_23870, partial [Chloroflexota bacterium]|nr:hypothetical protein [Chloroflexota bacterium]